MVQYKDIEIEIFSCSVRVGIADTIPEYLQFWTENFEPTHELSPSDYKDADGMVVLVEENGTNFWSLALERKAQHHIIAHEIFHLVMKLAHNKGCVWSNDSDEWYAYCISSFMKKVLDFIDYAGSTESTGNLG